MSQTPTTARGDIEFALAHSAPVVLRARRGSGYEIARVPLTTPVRIRKVAKDAFEGIVVNLGDAPAPSREEIHAFEGRIWRKAPGGASPALFARAFQNRDPMSQLRAGFEDLWLDPGRFSAEDGAFLDFHPEMPEGAADRLAVDLRSHVASGMARRFAEKVAHDGKDLWIAVDQPLMTPYGNVLGERAALLKAREPTWGNGAGRFLASRPVSFRTGHDGVEDIIRWRASNLGDRRRRNPKEIADNHLRAIAQRLGQALKGNGDPNADVARYVRTIATGLLPVTDTILNYKTRDRPKLSGAPADEIRSRVEGLLPHAMLAMVDMVPQEDHGLVLDKAEGLLRKLGEHLPHTGSYAISYVRAHLSFISHVVRPRLGGPIPEADEESLSSLGAR
jgi:hypothetical protein